MMSEAAVESARDYLFLVLSQNSQTNEVIAAMWSTLNWVLGGA